MRNKHALLLIILFVICNAYANSSYKINDTITTISSIGKSTVYSYSLNGVLVAQSLYRKSIILDSFKLESQNTTLVNWKYDKKNNICSITEFTFDSANGYYIERFRRDFHDNGTIKHEVYFDDVDSIKTNNISFTPRISSLANFINVVNSWNWSIEKELSFDKQGNLKKKVDYLSHTKNHTVKFYENGLIKEDYFYVTDTSNIDKKFAVSFKPDSICRIFYQSGIIQHEIVYDNGERHGLERYYYNNGNVKFERKFVNGVFQNPSIEWSEVGQKSEIYYKIFNNGMPNTGMAIKRIDF